MSLDLPASSDLTLEDADRIHRDCLAYEESLKEELQKSGRPLSLDPFLDAVPEALRPVLRRELLAIEREWWPCLPGYETLRFLGNGGMGRVYQARCLVTGDEVAIKLLLGGERERRWRLAQLAEAHIEHEHLVAIHGFLEHAGDSYLIMELVNGEDLGKQRERLRLDDSGLGLREWQLRKQQVVLLLKQIAEAMGHLHRRGVMHRDLKPGNVLLDASGQPHICDFGLAKEVDAAGGPTATAAVVGTYLYMAPEQARGEADLTLAADVWSLGAILFELLTGRPPFVSPTSGKVDAGQKQRASCPPLPSTLNPRLVGDIDLDHICRRCLALDPSERYQDAAALAADLGDYLVGKPVAPRANWWERLLGRLGTWNKPIRDEGYFPRHAWSLLREAATSLVAHLGLFALLLAGLPGQVLWLWLVGAAVSPGWVSWFWFIRRRTMTPMERDVLQLWGGVAVANLVLFALYCPFWGPAPPAEVVRFYPGCAVVLGLVFFAEGHFCWDRFYWVGAAYFAAALVLPLAGICAPVVFGLLYATTFVWLGLQAWRRAGPTPRGRSPRELPTTVAAK
jgi:serine/threonine protein kinase